MKKFLKLFAYRFENLSENLKISIVFIVWIAIVVFTNMKKTDANFVNHGLISSVILFYIMLFISTFYFSVEDETIRNIAALSFNNYPLYHICDMVVLWLYGVIFSLIGVGVPLALTKIGLLSYGQKIDNGYILASFELAVMLALLGVSVGSLFHPLIFTKRLSKYGLMFVICVCALTKDSIQNDRPFLKYPLWIVPPVSDIVGFIKGKKEFNSADINKTMIYFLIYFSVYSILRMVLVYKKRY